MILLPLCLLLTLTNAIVVQESYRFTAQFSFEIIRNSGILPTPDLRNWETSSSAFFANLYADLDLEDPILAPGVVMTIQSQDRFVASQPNFGPPNYGTRLDVEVVVTFRSEEFANRNIGFLALRIFDRDNKDNLIYFPSYLASLRAISDNFASTSKMQLDVSASSPFQLQSPIPTLPLPPPTDPPSFNPTKDPTIFATSAPSKVPSMAPSPSPSEMASGTPTAEAPTTLEPSTVPSLDPTASPISLSPTGLDETREPTPVPVPTFAPSSRPSAMPVLPLQTYYTTNELVLEDTNGILLGDSATQFVQVTSDYLTSYVQNVLRDTTVDQVIVDLTEQSHGPRQRQRRRRRQLDDNNNNNNKQLNVEFNTVLKVSTSTSFNAQSLIDGAFATSSRRENYRQLLGATGDEVLTKVATVRLPTGGGGGNTNEDDDGGSVIDTNPNQDPDGLGTGAVIGIAVGVCFFVLAIFGMWCQSSQRKKSEEASQKNMLPSTGQLSQEGAAAASAVSPRGRLDAEIVVDRSADDVSTLGDPFYGTALEEQTCADKTASSASVQQTYEFFKLLGKEDPNILGTTMEEEDTESKINRNTLFAEDDDSFEQVFGDTR